MRGTFGLLNLSIYIMEGIMALATKPEADIIL
jgi:hypothetical protein